MSLLSSTSGTPERTLSLLQILAAHDGKMPRGEVVAWLNPRFVQGGVVAADSPVAAEQTIGAATSLNFVSVADGQYVLEAGLEIGGLDDLADLTHQRLLSFPQDHPDAVLLQAFAFMVARAEQAKGTAWLHSSTNKTIADAINAALPGRVDTSSEGRRFNETKVAPYWRWIVAIGLALDLPGDDPHLYVAPRLARELVSSDLPVGEEIPIRRVLDVVAERMPYMDGGNLYGAAAEKLGLPAQARAISPILSTALRDLDEEGLITLGARSDAAGLVTLAEDRFSRTKAIQFATLNRRAVDA